MTSKLKYFSAFSGVGGFDLALNRNGHECVGYSEIDKYAVQTYKKNFGEQVMNYGDITKIDADRLPDFDLICGGFPCQSFSIAGKRRGFSDTRGTMFFEIARIVKIKRPKIVLLENVKGLLNHDEGRTFSVIMETLDELGYETQWMVLNSKFFGVPQNRERVFIIGSLRGERRSEVLPFRKSSCVSNEEIPRVSYTLDANYGKGVAKASRTVVGTLRTYNDGGGFRELQEPDRPEKRQNGRRFKEDGEEMFTLTGQDKHGVLQENMQIRRLTPIECERLQGFPDNWTHGVSDTQRYKQMGNAVTVNVVEAIIKRFINI